MKRGIATTTTFHRRPVRLLDCCSASDCNQEPVVAWTIGGEHTGWAACERHLTEVEVVAVLYLREGES